MLEVLRTMTDNTAKKPQMPQMNINLQMNLYLDSVDNKEGAGPFLASTRYDGLYHYDGKKWAKLYVWYVWSVSLWAKTLVMIPRMNPFDDFEKQYDNMA